MKKPSKNKVPTSTQPQKKSGSTRINKYIAEKGWDTRRGADELIASGLVYVNDVQAHVGQQVNAKDIVEMRRGTTIAKSYSYFAYHKPIGIETKDIIEKLPKEFLKLHSDTFPIGRLDKDSSGLIILTNDGRVTDRLLNPKYEHEKEYHVSLDKKVSNTLLRAIKEGMKMGSERTRPAKVRKTSDYSFDIILSEGKNRQIRRMCAAFGYDVKTLERFRIMNVTLSQKVGEMEELNSKTREVFLVNIGLKND